MQNSTKPWKRQPPKQGQASARQPVPLLTNNIRPSSAPAPHHSQPPRGDFNQRFHTQQRHGAPPTNEMMHAAMNNNTARFRAGVAKRPGMPANPHFASKNPPMEGCTGQSQHHYPSLMSLSMGQRQPNQQHQFSVCTDVLVESFVKQVVIDSQSRVNQALLWLPVLVFLKFMVHGKS